MKIKLEGVTKRFDDVVAVNDFSLEFEEGTLTAAWTIRMRQVHDAQYAFRYITGN